MLNIVSRITSKSAKDINSEELENHKCIVKNEGMVVYLVAFLVRTFTEFFAHLKDSVGVTNIRELPVINNEQPDLQSLALWLLNAEPVLVSTLESPNISDEHKKEIHQYLCKLRGAAHSLSQIAAPKRFPAADLVWSTSRILKAFESSFDEICAIEKLVDASNFQENGSRLHLALHRCVPGQVKFFDSFRVRTKFTKKFTDAVKVLVVDDMITIFKENHLATKSLRMLALPTKLSDINIISHNSPKMPMYNLHVELAIGDKLFVLKADTDDVKNHFLEAVADHNKYSGTDFPSMNFYANYWKFRRNPYKRNKENIIYEHNQVRSYRLNYAAVNPEDKWEPYGAAGVNLIRQDEKAFISFLQAHTNRCVFSTWITQCTRSTLDQSKRRVVLLLQANEGRICFSLKFPSADEAAAFDQVISDEVKKFEKKAEEGKTEVAEVKGDVANPIDKAQETPVAVAAPEEKPQVKAEPLKVNDVIFEETCNKVYRLNGSEGWQDFAASSVQIAVEATGKSFITLKSAETGRAVYTAWVSELTRSERSGKKRVQASLAVGTQISSFLFAFADPETADKFNEVFQKTIRECTERRVDESAEARNDEGSQEEVEAKQDGNGTQLVERAHEKEVAEEKEFNATEEQSNVDEQQREISTFQRVDDANREESNEIESNSENNSGDLEDQGESIDTEDSQGFSDSEMIDRIVDEVIREAVSHQTEEFSLQGHSNEQENEAYVQAEDTPVENTDLQQTEVSHDIIAADEPEHEQPLQDIQIEDQPSEDVAQEEEVVEQQEKIQISSDVEPQAAQEDLIVKEEDEGKEEQQPTTHTDNEEEEEEKESEIQEEAEKETQEDEEEKEPVSQEEDSQLRQQDSEASLGAVSTSSTLAEERECPESVVKISTPGIQVFSPEGIILREHPAKVHELKLSQPKAVTQENPEAEDTLPELPLKFLKRTVTFDFGDQQEAESALTCLKRMFPNIHVHDDQANLHRRHLTC